MKKILLTVVMFLAASVALAGEGYNYGRPQTTDTTVSGINTQQQQSTSGANNTGVSQGITFNSPAQPTKTTVQTTGQAASAFLTTSDGTCQGSQHLSGGWIGASAAEGSTYTVLPCNNRMNALVMNNLGEGDTGVQIMCTDSTVYLARKALNKPCLLKPSLLTVAIPGGMPLPTGSIENYARVEPAVVEKKRETAVDTRAVNPALDQAFKSAVMK